LPFEKLLLPDKKFMRLLLQYI